MKNKYASLTPTQLNILRDKGTERPFSEGYEKIHSLGTYLCRGCGHALFRANQQFSSTCGWPSFDDEVTSAVQCKPDADGHRVEILCTKCRSHLGHIFHGEGLTMKNTRYCVNAAAIDFVIDNSVIQSEEAIVAGGCFWRMEFLFQQKAGILKTEVGYTGGSKSNPCYDEVCAHNTGHVEAVRVVFDPNQLSYKHVIQYFFEIHDSTQVNGQGPDLGPQYLSEIFYYDDEQKKIAETVKMELQRLGYAVSTRILPVSIFWPAESYHQQYYLKNGKTPYGNSEN